jgi:hypothetical protein
MSENNRRHRGNSDRWLSRQKRLAIELLEKGRNESDNDLRRKFLLEAMRQGLRSEANDVAFQALSLAVLLNIGTGKVRELVGLMWPHLRDSETLLAAARSAENTHLLLWAAERALYFVPEFPSIPLTELERVLTSWLDALASNGGYRGRAMHRMRLHYALRMGHLQKATRMMKALETEEPESQLVPSPGQLPGTEPQSRGGKAVDFGCRAYKNQVRVLYHCAMDDAQSAWRSARYLVEGRSACDLSVCAMAPREALAALLEPLDRAGMRAEADRAHTVGMPLLRGSAVSLGWVGHHVRYWVRRGKMSEARSVLENAPTLEEAAQCGAVTPFHRFHFLRAVLCLTRASGEPSRYGGPDALEDQLRTIARAFDARNGSPKFEAMLDARDEI